MKNELPDIVVGADWSISPQKRWMAMAVLGRDGRYFARAPEPAGETGDLFIRLAKAAGRRGRVLLGFDFPVGVPAHYAELAGVTDFMAWLPNLGHGEWVDFYTPAEHPHQISLHRPFYPQKPGSARRSYLLQALAANSIDQLRRHCDLPQPGHRAAAPLFWTLGAQQVGKAAISGWRDVLGPALRDHPAQVAIWPFSGLVRDL